MQRLYNYILTYKTVIINNFMYNDKYHVILNLNKYIEAPLKAFQRPYLYSMCAAF